MAIIQISNLTKKFHGKLAVDNVDITLNKSSFFGFVGPNGAGKTTTVNMLTGILPPTSGTVKMFGLDFDKHAIEIKRQLGVVTEDHSLFEQLKADEQLYFVSRIYGLDKSTIKARSEELFEIFDLQDQRAKFVHEYSKGMKKKLALMCALIHNPAILFLDEPFEGIDPVSSNVIQENLKLLRQNGTTIFLTSHNLALVEKLCSEIAVIHNGQIVLHSSTDEIRNRIKNEFTKENYSGLEELFLDLVSPNQEIKYLSWVNETVK